MSRKLRYGTSLVNFDVDDFATDILTRVIDQGFPGVRQRVESGTSGLYADAYAAWPVKTGKSKAALDWSMRVESDAIVGTVANPATKDGYPYAYAIRTPDEDGSRRVWDLLIRKPGVREGERMADDLAPLLANVAAGKGS